MTANDKARAALLQPQRQADPVDSMLAMLAGDSMKRQFEMALPSHLQANAGRYIRSFMTQIRQVPRLVECSKASLLGAMLTGTALGLDPTPGLGEFYILPYGNEAQFQLGYKGMLALAYRGGVRKIWAHEVCKGDEFDIEWGMVERLFHKPLLDGERGDVRGYYAAAVLPNGEVSFVYKNKGEVEAHGRRFSRSYGRGPWVTDFDAMAKKTVAKQLFNWLPKSTELARAIARDETIVLAQPEHDIRGSEDVFDMQAEVVQEVVATATERIDETRSLDAA